MSCKNERAETDERNDATKTEQRGSGFACPCGECPPKAKWVCLAGLAGALGLVAFRVFRHATAPS